MKKMVKSIVAAACVCALFAGCGKAPEEAAKVVPPEEVALDYMKSMQSGKVDEAYLKEHCTENAVKIIGELLSSGKEGVMSEMKGIKFSVGSVKVDGDSAKVTLTKEGPGGKDSDTIDLKKVDGKWRVDVEPSW